jgi:hypothetical protein
MSEHHWENLVLSIRLASTGRSVVPSGLWPSTQHPPCCHLKIPLDLLLSPNYFSYSRWMERSSYSSHFMLWVQNYFRPFYVDRNIYIMCGAQCKKLFGGGSCLKIKNYEMVAEDWAPGPVWLDKSFPHEASNMCRGLIAAHTPYWCQQ